MEIEIEIGSYTCEAKVGNRVFLAMDTDELITLYYESESDNFHEFVRMTLLEKLK